MQALIQYLSSHSGAMIYLIALGILIACGLGIPIPEDITLLALGYFAHLKVIDVRIAMAVAMLGVLLGDSIIYYIGYHYGDYLLQLPVLRRVFRQERIDKVRDSFDRYGNLFIFMARFAVGLRAVTFWSAGHFRIPFRTFILYDGLAALISVPLLVWLGMVTGVVVEQVLKYERYVGFGAAGVIALVIGWSIYRHRRRKDSDVS